MRLTRAKPRAIRAIRSTRIPEREDGHSGEAGSEQVWIVDPEARTLTVYRKDRHTPTVFNDRSQLVCEGVLEGVEFDTAEIFPPACQ